MMCGWKLSTKSSAADSCVKEGLTLTPEKLLAHDRDRLKAVVMRSENWPVSKDKLSIKFYKNFKEFTNNILLDKV